MNGPRLAEARRLTWLSLFLAMTAPSLVQAATTGNAQLFMPQGTNGGKGFGDYVSAGDALNTSYHYYVEVPAGLPRLEVELFDADVGLGGTGEGNAGRDRALGGFDTTANYSLFTPSGIAVATRFATGSVAGPSGADNAWLVLFDSTSSVRDEFGAVAYNNNDGADNWSTNWVETSDDGNANAGDIRIVTDGTHQSLRIQNPGKIIERHLNLAGRSSATLTFSFRRNGLDLATDYVALESGTPRRRPGLSSRDTRDQGPTQAIRRRASTFPRRQSRRMPGFDS